MKGNVNHDKTVKLHVILFLSFYDCLRTSIAVKRLYDHSKSYKGKHLIVVSCLQFKGLVYYWHCGKQVDMQIDMALKKELTKSSTS